MITILSILSIASSLSFQEKRDIPVDVRVEVRTSDDKPLAHAALAGVTMLGAWRADADQSGVAAFKIRVADPEDRVHLRLLHHIVVPDGSALSPKEVKERRSQYRTSFRGSFWPAIIEAPVVDGPDGSKNVLLTLRGEDAVRVLGRFDFGAQPVMPINVAVIGSAEPVSAARDSLFDLTAKKGAAGEIQVTLEDGRLFWHPWDAAAASADVDLGVIAIPEKGVSGTVSGTVIGSAYGDSRRHSGVQGGAMLLREDGSFAVANMTDGSKVDPRTGTSTAPGALEGSQPTVKSSVPVGRYLVLPGSLELSSTTSIIREAIRNGEDVSKKWGIEIISVDESTEVVFTLDATRVHAAVLGTSVPVIDPSNSSLIESSKVPPGDAR
jgi:hypothetical protein